MVAVGTAPRDGGTEDAQDYCPPSAGEIRERPSSGSLLLEDVRSNLEPYHAFLFNSGDGTEQTLGNITPDGTGAWQSPEFPVFRDWWLFDHKG